MSRPSASSPVSASTGDLWLKRPARGRAELRRDEPWEFHARLPGYAPTPIHRVPVLAERLGVGTVLVKDESRRFDLPAFKILGASWGVYRSLCQRLGGSPRWTTVSELGRQLAPLGRPCLLAATAGNHGRALARMARWLGLPALILLPAVTSPRTAAAIEGEGAALRWIDGSYDAAVAAAAGLAEHDHHYLLVQDTSWPGYEQVPRWIVDGYATMFQEIDDQLASAGVGTPDAVVVPVGVGSLLSAAVRHYRAPADLADLADPGDRARTALLGVEPVTAACLLASLRADRPVTVPTAATVMEGLNAGSVSPAAWPLLRAGVDAAVTVTDEAALASRDLLEQFGIGAGACGAATLAGLSSALSGPDSDEVRKALGLSTHSTVVLLDTDGRPGS